MPFIQIKSLPLDKPLDITDIIKGITGDFAKITNIQPNHIHTSWEFFNPAHFAKGANTPLTQPYKNHPILVDLLTPDFNDTEVVAVMLQSIADSISQRANFPINNIFINHRQAHSKMVFDDGAIVEW